MTVHMGAAIVINTDGTWTIDPRRCVAYPDDESAYTGCLDMGKAKLYWVKGEGFVHFGNDIRVCVGDLVYEAIQRGLVRVGVR